MASAAERAVSVVGGIVLMSLMTFTLWIGWNQYREMRASGNRLPRWVVAVIAAAIGGGVVFGVWLSSTRS